ncbi:MAG: sodium-dependent bicarbonate transport family permease [Bdellovibrionales bacterium]|nr:sodium-dependent bicarbonate transport family permease [Bdellovibrionales bacterium]
MSFFTQSTDSERETDLVTPLPIKPLLFLTIAALGIFQVFFLESSPPGFYVDEAAASAQILCLSNFHQNCWGDSWPFFTTVWGVARVGPVHQYSGAVWVSLFGGSIESLRTLSVFYGLLTTFALSLLAKYRGGERLQLWTTLAALTLPWALHSSRLAWDPPVAPFYVVLCLLLLEIGVRSTQYRIPLIVGSAVSFLLAALAYPPVLAQMVFLVGFIFVFQRLFFPKSFKTVLLFAALCAVASFAILFMNTDPVHGRVAEVGIFGNDPRNPTTNLGL